MKALTRAHSIAAASTPTVIHRPSRLRTKVARLVYSAWTSGDCFARVVAIRLARRPRVSQSTPAIAATNNTSVSSTLQPRFAFARLMAAVRARPPSRMTAQESTMFRHSPGIGANFPTRYCTSPKIAMIATAPTQKITPFAGLSSIAPIIFQPPSATVAPKRPNPAPPSAGKRWRDLTPSAGTPRVLHQTALGRFVPICRGDPIPRKY
jgi:hypothetical protein